jgi:hypothetical protein
MNPFEIRADLIKVAQDYLQAQYDANVEFSKQTVELMLKEGKMTADQLAQYVPKMYAFEDIIAKAKELYGFVKEKQ